MGKSLLLASALTLLYVVAITLIFRIFPIRHRARTMTRLFLLTVPLFIVLHLLTPADLGFLPESLVEPMPWVGLVFGLVVYGAGFGGGVLQLYNLAERGFSLRIVMDIDEAPSGALTAEEVATGYSRGKGLAWMYQKRLDGLLAQQLVVREEDWVGNSERGRRAARVFAWLRRFLQLDPRP